MNPSTHDQGHNELVPFEYESFKVREAVWPDPSATIRQAHGGEQSRTTLRAGPRSVRFPRAEVGRLFRGDHGCHSDTHVMSARRAQNLVQIIIRRNPPLQSLGTPLAVRGLPGTPGDREYTAICYSMDEIYQLAIHSQLPGARNFLHIYPRLKEAEILGRFERVAPKDARERYAIERLDEILALGTRARESGEVKREMMEAFGRSRSTITRWARRRETRLIPPLRKGRSDAGKLRRFPEDLRQQVWAIIRREPEIKTKKVWELVEKRASYATVRYWRQQAQGREIAA